MQQGDVVKCIKPNGFGGIEIDDVGIVVEEMGHEGPGNYNVYWGLREGHHWQPAHLSSSGWYEAAEAKTIYNGVIARVPPLLVLALAAADALPILPNYIKRGA